MIVASHQPNFMPYMGYFYKMYLCDIFTLSDTVGYSKRAYHNYNYFNEAGESKKVTVPVSIRNGQSLNQAMLSDWEHNQVKLLKRLEGYYAKAPYFKTYFPYFERVLTRSYYSLTELNIALLEVFADLFHLPCKIIRESDLHIEGDSATEQIIDICTKTVCDTYLSGEGARDYFDEELFKASGFNLQWTGYTPLQYGSPLNLSAFDYLMYCGKELPASWKYDRERLRNGKDL